MREIIRMLKLYERTTIESRKSTRMNQREAVDIHVHVVVREIIEADEEDPRRTIIEVQDIDAAEAEVVVERAVAGVEDGEIVAEVEIEIADVTRDRAPVHLTRRDQEVDLVRDTSESRDEAGADQNHVMNETTSEIVLVNLRQHVAHRKDSRITAHLLSQRLHRLFRNVKLSFQQRLNQYKRRLHLSARLL